MNIIKVSVLLLSLLGASAWAIPWGTKSPLGCFNMSMLIAVSNSAGQSQEQDQEQEVEQVLLPTGLKICTSVKNVADLKSQDYFVRKTGEYTVKILDNNNTIMATYNYTNSIYDGAAGINFEFLSNELMTGETAMNMEDNFPYVDEYVDIFAFQMYDDQQTCDAEYGMVAFQGNSYYLYPVVNECE